MNKNHDRANIFIIVTKYSALQFCFRANISLLDAQ